MQTKSKKKATVAIVVIAVLLLLSIPTFIRALDMARLTHRSLQYAEPFVDLALTYVQEETDAAERYGYGEPLTLRCTKRVTDFYEDDKATFSSADEFQSALRYLEIYIDVNDRATCVIVFEPNEQKKLEITKYFWE